MRGDEQDEDSLAELFEDLEQQATGLHLAERDAEVADRARGEYASVTLADRVHASSGRRVALHLAGGLAVEGDVRGAGADWVLLDVRDQTGTAQEWLIRLEAIAWVSGLSPRAFPESVRPATARLTVGAAARRWADLPEGVTVHLAGGERRVMRIGRVGADFLEGLDPGVAAREGHGPVLLPFAAVTAIRRG